MNLDLSGKHALVCGGSQGIGRACAIELAQLGANVTLMARRADVLQQVVAELPRTHATQKHGFITVDSGDTDALRSQAQALVATGALSVHAHASRPPSRDCSARACSAPRHRRSPSCTRRSPPPRRPT